MQTPNSITIKWQSPKAEIGCVQYGKTTLDQKSCEDAPSQEHTLSLNNLDEGSRYLYSVESASLKIDNTNRYFNTLDGDPNKTQYIWIIGDSGKPGADQNRVYAQMQNYMKDKTLSLWLLLGDNAYRSGTQKQYNAALFEPYKELIKSSVPWAVIGNHDARRWAFYDIFDLPSQGESGGLSSGSEKFYAIDQGDIHILMIDSETSDLSPRGELAQWLEKDLKATTKKWIIAAFHHPPYTDGGHHSDNERDSHYTFSLQGRLFLIRENIIPILEKHDVDLVYSGHSHVYERSKLMHKHYLDSSHFDAKTHLVQDSNNSYCKSLKKSPYGGTVYTVSGSAAKLDQGSLKHPALPFSHEKMGSVIVKVTPEKLTSSFISIEGEIEDSFTLEKREDCF